MKPTTLIGVVIVLAVIGGVWYWMSQRTVAPLQTSLDYKNATYVIENQPVTLSSPGITYFGNEAEGDLNGDGMPDRAFLLTYDGGGSGTFYYAVVALKTASGYEGTNGILLGDRIAPQTTEIKNGQVIVNYADRNPGEPMTAQPSLGVSKYLTVTGTELTVL